jgi:hypothetical protein
VLASHLASGGRSGLLLAGWFHDGGQADGASLIQPFGDEPVGPMDRITDTISGVIFASARPKVVTVAGASTMTVPRTTNELADIQEKKGQPSEWVTAHHYAPFSQLYYANLIQEEHFLATVARPDLI